MVDLRLPPEAASATRARQEARAFLAGRVDEDSLERAALIVTELVANGVMHAATTLRLTIGVEGTIVRIELRDESDRMPQPRVATAASSSGRGLALIDHMASRWGVETSDVGKVVWCELALPEGADDEADGAA